MMIICPKCGFSQPKDRYCANCGVDIENFKPKADPLRSRITKSSGFYIFLVGIVIVSTIYFIFQQKDLVIPANFSQLQKTVNQIPSQQTTANTPSAQIEVTTTLSQPQADTQLAASAPESTLPPAPAPLGANLQHDIKSVGTRGDSENLKTDKDALASQGDNKALPARYKKPTSPKMRIYFIEIPDDQIQAMLEGSSGDDRQGVVPDFANRLNKHRSALTIFDSVSRAIPNPAEPFMVFQGGVDKRINNNTGLMVQVSPNQIEENSLIADIQIKRTLAESNGREITANTQNFSGEFTVSEGAAIYFAGTMPRKALPEEEKQYYSTSILKVMNSPAFTAGSSEFFVFIEIQGLSAGK